MARTTRTIVGVALLVLLALLGAFTLLRSELTVDPQDAGALPQQGDAPPAPEPPVTAEPAPVEPSPAPRRGTTGIGGGGTGLGRGGRGAVVRPQPARAPTPDKITDRFADVDAALGELVQGNVAFNAPQRMRFGETRTIALVASPALDPDTLSTELRDRVGGVDPIEVAALHIAPLMEAALQGAPAFEVTPLTPSRQPVSRATPTEWRWSVRATQAGTHALHLTINAILIVDGERYPRSLDVLNREIEVDITAAQQVGMFLQGNWQWLLGTIVLPLAVWLWSHQRKQPRRRRTRP